MYGKDALDCHMNDSLYAEYIINILEVELEILIINKSRYKLVIVSWLE